jgi:hypothetical protein
MAAAWVTRADQTGLPGYFAPSGIQQLSTTLETDWDSVRTTARWAVVRPPSALASAGFGPMSTTFQPTTANLASRALTAHFTLVPGSLVTWKSISDWVESVVL